MLYLVSILIFVWIIFIFLNVQYKKELSCTFQKWNLVCGRKGTGLDVIILREKRSYTVPDVILNTAITFFLD